jgi:hypothetical protein
MEQIIEGKLNSVEVSTVETLVTAAFEGSSSKMTMKKKKMMMMMMMKKKIKGLMGNRQSSL